MSQAANITSLESLQSLKAALAVFDEAVRNALVALELESRRPLEWIEHDRTRYWPAQVRKASDAVSEARLALARCETSTTGERPRDCYDERKALEKAKRRLHLAEAKVEAVRRWRHQLKRHVEEFLVETARLRAYLDSDFLRAAGSLQKMLEALDRYVGSGGTPNPTAEGATHGRG
jgi:hypothetical protein